MRKIKQKSFHKRVAIIGEGLTEWFYFNSLRQTERFKFDLKPELPKRSEFRELIKLARQKKEEGYDLVYIVLDMDRMIQNASEKHAYFNEKSKTKKNSGIHFIESMPCIELWFLLHFLKAYSSRTYQSFEEIKPRLEKYYPEYEKSLKFFRKTKLYDFLNEKGNELKATEFAERLIQDKEKNDNPYANYTEIARLLVELRQKQ